MGVERVLELLKEQGVSTPAPCPTSMPWCPTRRPCRRRCVTLGRCATAGVRAQMHAATGRRPGQHQVAVQEGRRQRRGLCARLRRRRAGGAARSRSSRCETAAARRHRRSLSNVAAWAAHPTIPGSQRLTANGHPTRSRRTGTARPAQAFLDHLRHPHHLGGRCSSPAPSWPGMAGSTGSATRRPRHRRSTMKSSAAPRPVTSPASSARLGRHEAVIRRHGLRAAGRPAGRPNVHDKGNADGRGRARMGGRQCGRPGLPSRGPAASGGRSSSKPSPTTMRSRPSRPSLPKEFEPLVDDRRGDIYIAQGKREEAKAAYQRAWTAFGPRVEYRRLVEIKLNSAGRRSARASPPLRGRRISSQSTTMNTPTCRALQAVPARSPPAAALVAALAACSGTPKPKPAELAPNVALLAIKQAWNVRIPRSTSRCPPTSAATR